MSTANPDHSPSLWERTRKTSLAGVDTLWKWADKLGAPVNKLSNKLGSEAFWPTTLDKESDKAARILRSFCKDGFYKEEEVTPSDGPKQKQKVIKKIPQKVIQNAVGLVIFTAMRTGLWYSGSGGSGVLIARLEDGSWSAPSGILLHTVGLGLLAGIDIYDCVIVINNRKALAAFTKLRFTVGGEISAVAGPVGVGAIADTELHKRQAALFTYMKSRGLYGGIQADGTIVIERTDENERFYGTRIPAIDIISGKVRVPYECRRLVATIRSAEGKTDVDESLIPDEKPPGDFEVEPSAHIFGVPDEEDPDPYGVHALQVEGLGIREAGTQAEPEPEEFDFKPSVTSPMNVVFEARKRRSTLNGKSSSIAEATSIEHATPGAGASPSILEDKLEDDEIDKAQSPITSIPPVPKFRRIPPPLPSRGNVAGPYEPDSPGHIMVSPTSEGGDIGETSMSTITLEDNEREFEDTSAFHTPSLEHSLVAKNDMFAEPFKSTSASRDDDEQNPTSPKTTSFGIHGDAKLPGAFD